MYEVGEDRYVTFYKMSALEFAAGCDLDYHQTLVGHILFFFPCGCSNFVGVWESGSQNKNINEEL